MAIIRGLISLAEARTSLGWSATDTTNNTDLEAYISAATPYIEYISGPMFAESRTVTFDGGRRALLLPHRFNTVTSVTVSGVVSTSYVADAEAGIIFGGSTSTPANFGSGTRNVVVVVTVGYATIPPNVSLATRELVRLWWQQGRQANKFGAPDEAQLTTGILGRVKALLGASPPVAGFA